MSRALRSFLGRFALVGATVTVIDVVTFVVLRRAGLALVVADVIAVATAAVTSYALHRWLTFRNDPFVRWVHAPATVALVVTIAGLADVSVLVIVVGPDSRAVLPLVAAKVVALSVAAVIRLVAYRWLLFQAVRATHQPRDRGTAPGSVRLSVVVPAFNEAERIGATVRRLREELASVAAAGGLEIVVVDDGSPDDTVGAARAAGADQAIRLARNAGKGGAVRAGVLAATGRTIAFTDADLAYAPDQLLPLLARVEEGWDLVVGSRRHVETTTLVRARRVREIGGRVINLFTMALLLGQYRDTQCGLKAFRSDVGRLLFSQTRIDGFAFDIELFHLAERYELSVLEAPVSVENSERSTVKIARDALRLVRDLVRIRRWAKGGVYAELPGDGRLEPVDRARSAAR